MPLNFGVVEEMGRWGAEEVAVEWQIPNFPRLLDGRDGDWYWSPEFRMGDVRWYLSLWPNCGREAGNPASGWMSLELGRWYGNPASVTVRFSVGIRGSGGVEKIREEKREFKGYDNYGWKEYCSRSDLLEHRTRLMPDDTLTIRCVLKRPGADRAGVLSHPHSSNQVAPTDGSQSSDKRDACTQTDCKLEAEVQESTVKRGCEKVHEDFARLLTSGEDSDVTVQVGDVELRVHRNILSARCPVLAAMFRHDTEERATNSIKIDDCEPDIFREYLHYLYTGSVRSLAEETVFGLYRIADKYLAEDLKRLCLEHVRATLSVRTFCEAVKLALTHGQSDLLRLSVDFAARNLPLIIRSVEWQNFNCEYPREANEILVKCIRP